MPFATKTVTTEVLSILAHARPEGEKLYLTGQLDRPTYKRVNDALEAVGGKWDRKAKSHVFDGDAAEALEEILLTGTYTNRKQQFQFFETPAPLAARLVAMADVKVGHHALEPSAGGGRILSPLVATGAHCYFCELDAGRHAKLINDYPTADAVGSDFLAYAPPPLYDRVVANPPFTRQQDIAHVLHMLDVTMPGGIVVSVMSSSVTFRDDSRTVAFMEAVERHDCSVEALPPGTFKESGTMANAIIIKVVKRA